MKQKLITNLTSDIKNKIKLLSSNKYAGIGIKWKELKRLRSSPANLINSTYIAGNIFYFKGSDELFHAIDEIFLQELYKIEFRKKNPVIIDCGAHIGVSVLYLKQKYPESEIIAFEPDPGNFELLSKNVQANNFSGIELRNEAVWIENTELSFSNSGSMSSKIEESNANEQSVTRAIRLRDILISKIDFLKIDIEGAEYRVLLDIADKLENIEYLFVEYHGSFKQNSELNELLNIFTTAGFSYYIKEANPSYKTPFHRNSTPDYDIQLNLFCFRNY